MASMMRAISVALPGKKGPLKGTFKLIQSLRRDPIYTLLSFFWSVKVAFILIFIIAVAVLIGTVIIQVPRPLLSSPEAYDLWVEGLRPKYGALTDLFRTLSFYNVFGSLWFRALLGLVALNVTICTLHRAGPMWRSIARVRVRQGDGFFREGKNRTILTSSLGKEEAFHVLKEALRRRRYRVSVEEGDGKTYIYAERNRFGQFFTYMNHVGLVLLIAGAAWGVLGGFSDGTLAIPDGSMRAVGHGTNLVVLNEGFVEIDYPDGRPADFYSDLVLYEDGVEVNRQRVRVNNPMRYKGISFYQGYFGNAPVIQVKDAQGNVLYDDGVALAFKDPRFGEFRPVGTFYLFDNGLGVDVIGMAVNVFDPDIAPGETLISPFNPENGQTFGVVKLVQGEPQTIGGLEFNFLRERQYTGIIVGKNPAIPLIWVAAGLIIGGTFVVFNFPHRRFWGRCSSTPSGAEVALTSTSSKSIGLGQEFDKIVENVKRSLKSKEATLNQT